MITPKRKPLNLPLHPDDKAYNKTVNQVRYKIERVIANIKTWRVLHTGYRRPLDTFPETIHSRPRTHIHLHPMNKPRVVICRQGKYCHLTIDKESSY